MTKTIQTTDKLALIAEIYKVCYGATSFFSIGPELSYTTQAILSDMRCELNPLSEFIRLLKEKLPQDHIIWQHIYLEPTVLCINCEMEILLDQAAFCQPLEGWLGHNCCVDARMLMVTMKKSR